MPDSLEDEINEWYGGKIRSGLSEDERVEDIIRAVALFSKERAERENRDSPSEEDIEWALGILCFLPLMPKDEESTKACV